MRNGYMKWAAVMLAIGGIIFAAGQFKSKADTTADSLDTLEQKVDKAIAKTREDIKRCESADSVITVNINDIDRRTIRLETNQRILLENQKLILNAINKLNGDKDDSGDGD